MISRKEKTAAISEYLSLILKHPDLSFHHIAGSDKLYRIKLEKMGTEEPTMKMSIEEAIEGVYKSREWIIKNLRVSDAVITLLRVTEAWLKLEGVLRSELCTDDNMVSLGHKVWKAKDILELMDQLLNPPPKSKWDRLREWVNQKAVFNRTYYDIKEFIDQLEKEGKTDDTR